MRRILVTLAIPALLAGAGIGCSKSSDEPLTLPEYFQSMAIVLGDTSEGTAFLTEPENSALWLKDLEASRELLDRSLAVSEETEVKLRRINPPVVLETPHNNLVASFSTILAGSRDLKQRLAAMSTNIQLADFVAAELPLPGIPDASKTFRESCTSLEEYAGEQGIRVDLHCAEI